MDLLCAYGFGGLDRVYVGCDEFGVFTLVDAKEQQVAAIDCAGLGIIVTLAAAFHVWEPSEARKRDLTTTSRLGAAVWLISLAICLLSVIIGATGATYFAVIFGVTTLVAIVAIRQLNLGSWGQRRSCR